VFQTLKNAWSIPEIRKKFLYTVMMIIVFRIGSAITVPFLDMEAVKSTIESYATDGNFLEYLNTLTGGALSKATIFSLSITPYINASIIIQLLTYALPPLERLQEEGEEGRKVLNKITAYVALALSLFMSIAYYLTLRNSSTGSVEYTSGAYGWYAAIVIVACFTAGASFVVWMGNRINDKGIGNGISMILFAGIVARFPNDVLTLVDLTKTEPQKYFFVSLAVLVVFVLMVGFIVFMNEAERRIPIQYAKRVVGRKQIGGQNTHIPVKVCMSGVMPIIFAMAFMSLPSTISLFISPVDSLTDETGFWARFYYHFINFFKTTSWGYAALYLVLIIAFNYFYVAMQYNPIEIANNLRQNNGGIPGIRPGKPTSDYIQRVLSKITLVGAVFLGIIAIFPIAVTKLDSSLSSLSMGGTSILIVVSVALETARTLESQLMMRHHKGFLG
jgi:preprotein translocase subunit SecY